MRSFPFTVFFSIPLPHGSERGFVVTARSNGHRIITQSDLRIEAVYMDDPSRREPLDPAHYDLVGLDAAAMVDLRWRAWEIARNLVLYRRGRVHDRLGRHDYDHEDADVETVGRDDFGRPLLRRVCCCGHVGDAVELRERERRGA